MPGGNPAPSQRSGFKPGQSNQAKHVNTVQTLLSAKIDPTKEKAAKKGRTHSELSNESNNSIDLDLSGLENIQKDLHDIKSNLQGIVKFSDLNEATKDLVKNSELESLVTKIVDKLFTKFEKKIETKIEEKVEEKVAEKVNQFKLEMEEKIDALSIENTNMKLQIEKSKEQICKTKIDNLRNENHTSKALEQCNRNEQYSRKNNIKIFNMKWRERQNLREDFIELVRNELRVELEPRDVVAIHRLPSNKPGDKPVIVRLFNSDIKRKVMREKKNLKNRVIFLDDITQENYELMKRLRESGRFVQVWFFNCHVYARTEDDLQLKFGLFDDIDQKIRIGK